MRLTKSESGFSLIELMIVISIMGLLIAISIPSTAMMRVRAARAGALNNLNVINTLGKAYCDDHPTNCTKPGVVTDGSVTIFHYGNGSSGGVGTTRCEPNSLGFSTTDCDKSYYNYSFSIVSGAGPILEAHSSYIQGSGYTSRTGNRDGPPTRFCKPPLDRSFYKVYYLDRLTMTNEVITNLENQDAIKDCFDPKRSP